MRKEARDFYIRHGLCGCCGKRTIRPGEVACEICNAKKAEYVAKKRENDRESYNEYMKEYMRKRRAKC